LAHLLNGKIVAIHYYKLNILRRVWRTCLSFSLALSSAWESPSVHPLAGHSGKLNNYPPGIVHIPDSNV
jgi:hypothetical protein